MKVVYKGPCKQVSVPGIGVFTRDIPVELGDKKARTIVDTNVNFKMVTTKTKEVKKNARR